MGTMSKTPFQSGFETGCLWSTVFHAKKKDRRAAAINYCQAIIDLRGRGVISAPEAGYKICSLGMFDGLRASLDEAIEIACDLEMPAYVRTPINANTKKAWSRLVELVDRAQHDPESRPHDLVLSFNAVKYNPGGEVTEGVTGLIWAEKAGLQVRVGDLRIQTKVIEILTDSEVTKIKDAFNLLQGKIVEGFTIIAEVSL